MYINKRMDKQIYMYSNDGILCSSEVNKLDIST